MALSLLKLPNWIKPLRPFEGIARKVVLPFIALSAIGWIVYVRGFRESTKEYDDPEDDPRLFPYWAASVVGPVLFLLAILHALLWKWPNAATGSVTAILGIVYVASIGVGIHFGGSNVSRNYYDAPKKESDLWFAGGLITCLFWAITQVTWLWYPVKSVRDLKNLMKIKPLKPVAGIARKVALPLIGVSAVGWLIFTVGFRKLINEWDDSSGVYWGWMAIGSGVILHILAVLHTVMWGLPSVILGSLAAVFGVLYMISIGFGLYISGMNLKYDYKLLEYRLIFAGCFLSSLFWAISQAMWPWYVTGIEPEQELREDRKKLWKWIAFKPYRPVEGVFRKAVLIVIGISIIGWIVFISGFRTYIEWIKREEDNFYDTHELHNDQFFKKYATQLYWGWTGGIGGLVVYLLATAHSVMWTRTSCILGSVTAIVGMMYITAVGYSFVWSGIVIDGDGPRSLFWFSDRNYSRRQSRHHSLVFAGCFLIYLFWGVMLALWLWFPYGTMTAFKSSLKLSPPRFFEGTARKIALPLIALSAVGCFVFANGFKELRDSISDKELEGVENGPWLFWGWAGSVVGPVVCLLAVVHALLWRAPSAVVGTLTAMLGALYIAAIGSGMVYVGITFTRTSYLGFFDVFYKKIFSGGLIASFFWALVVALWPWYSSGLCEGETAASDGAGQNRSDALVQSNSNHEDDAQVVQFPLNAENSMQNKTAIDFTPVHQ